MQVDTPSHLRIHTTTLSNSALPRPNITFNYLPPRTHLLVHPSIANSNLHYPPLPHVLKHHSQHRQQPLQRRNQLSQQIQVLSHRDCRRKKIFAKSRSNNDLISLCRVTQTYKTRHAEENRQTTEENEAKSKVSHKRKNIFECYNPKSRVQASQDQRPSHQSSAKLLSMNFERPLHPKKLTNYLQLTPNRLSKRTEQEAPFITITAESYLSRIPLRDTYVPERDCPVPIPAQQSKGTTDILQEELYEIPLDKMEESFTHKLDTLKIATRSRHNPGQKLEVELQPVRGSQSHTHAQHPEDLPQLFQLNQRRASSKTENNQRERSKSQSLVEIKFIQTCSNSDRNQAFWKQPIKDGQFDGKGAQGNGKGAQVDGIRESAFTLPYVLVLMGVLLLMIQFIK